MVVRKFFRINLSSHAHSLRLSRPWHNFEYL